ncbi:hypothetical protein H2198_009624 [Neophaeococcomyces mojaviensis]|uniref:Uncharacterized protein n=1 Tax=Neophaeococcomyces mojaviensis TaxID=3383035 RepID=A0ACC2ZTZ3_9EURO|nr:hypothetical protein H2198_009624 [Knufia sp. JES_112]
MSQSDEALDDDVTPISPAERINELNDIDQTLSKLPFHLSKVLGLVANQELDKANPKLDDVQEEFEQHCKAYFAKLSSVEVRLRRQVYALEEAGRIPQGTKYDERNARSMNDDQTSRRGGGGPLDISWLNARAHDSVGQGLRREVLDGAIEFLRRNGIEKKSSTDTGGEAMQVDEDEE